MPLSVVYYGSRISDHITETPEGYLVCHDVPIARTGTQKYLGRETPDPKENPEREISCGYDCLWAPDGDRYIQRNIRGNHIAVVDRGRAGPRVSIHDSKPKGEKRMSKKSLLGKILAAFARDAEPEELGNL